MNDLALIIIVPTLVAAAFAFMFFRCPHVNTTHPVRVKGRAGAPREYCLDCGAVRFHPDPVVGGSPGPWFRYRHEGHAKALGKAS